jgi:hypothetical protein
VLEGLESRDRAANANEVVSSAAEISHDESQSPTSESESKSVNADTAAIESSDNELSEQPCRSVDPGQWFPLSSATVDYWLTSHM